MPTARANFLHHWKLATLLQFEHEKSESRRRLSLERDLREADARNKNFGRSSDREGGSPSDPDAGTPADPSARLVADLRGQVARARERAEILEDRLDETVRMNRRLEREVAEAVGLGVRGRGGAYVKSFLVCHRAKKLASN